MIKDSPGDEWSAAPDHRRARGLLAGLAAVAVLGLVGLLVLRTGTVLRDALRPERHVWYVSKRGNDANGRSWATAWTELAHIRWGLVQPGDVVAIDGGPTRCAPGYDFVDHATTRPGLRCGMMYTTSLEPLSSGTAHAPLTIRLATDPGRDGTAVLFGGRQAALPWCNQPSYSPRGRALPTGILVPGQQHLVIDGVHRSGFMVYGAMDGVDLSSDQTRHVTLRNMEIFDNGVVERWAHGWRSDGEGLSLVGQHITIERSLIHDNGQDGIQDRYTGDLYDSGHAPMSDIVLRDSWLYNRRDHPRYPGYSFNSGAQDNSTQDCTHVDGVQVWGGGLHQERFTVDHVVFGPLLAQGLYLGSYEGASFDDVTVSNSLFINALSHSIVGEGVAAQPSTPRHWTIKDVTSYLTGQPVEGMAHNGAVDLSGRGHVVRDSVFLNGYFWDASSFDEAASGGNVYFGGERPPGAVRADPQFSGRLPTTRAPGFGQLTAVSFSAQCGVCTGKGADLHSVADLVARIDALNAGDRKSGGR